MSDYYEVLGVSRSSTFAEIKKKYLLLVRNYHPDKLPPGTPDLVRKDATEKFLLIQRAYEVLTTSERFQYDAVSESPEQPASQPQPPPSYQPEPNPSASGPRTPHQKSSGPTDTALNRFLYRTGQNWQALERYIFRNHVASLLWTLFLALGIPAAIYLPLAGNDGVRWNITIPEPVIILSLILMFGVLLTRRRIAAGISNLLVQHPVRGALAVQIPSLLLILLITAAISSQPAKNPATNPEPIPTTAGISPEARPAASGTYVGTVRNLTASMSAEIEMAGVKNGDTITGCFVVHRPLYGSGPFVGKNDGSKVEFSVNSSMFVLRFTGVKKPSSLQGTYVVVRDGAASENGTFELHAGSGTKPPNTKDCEKD